jgi:membrane-associated phospholipid phosphatase
MQQALSRRDDRLVPRGFGAAAGVVAGLAGLAVVLLAVACAGGRRAGPFDRHWDRWLEQRLGRGAVVRALADAGNTVPVTVAAVALIVALVWLHRPRAALLAATAVPVSVALIEWLLKPVVDRRYDGTFRSFPSGHAGAVFALAFVAVAVLVRSGLPAWLRVLVSLVLLAVAAGSAAALVAGHYHYVTDTMGGACVSLAVVLGLALTIDAGAHRRARNARSATPGGSPGQSRVPGDRATLGLTAHGIAIAGAQRSSAASVGGWGERAGVGWWPVVVEGVGGGGA